MATQQEIQQAQQRLTQERQRLLQAQQSLEQSRAKTQRELRTTTKLERQRQVQQISAQQQQYQQYAKELSGYETEISQAEKQLKAQQEQIARQAEYETAIKVYAGQITAPKGFDPSSEMAREAQRYVESSPSLSGSEKLGITPLTSTEYKVYTSPSFAGARINVLPYQELTSITKTTRTSDLEKYKSPSSTGGIILKPGESVPFGVVDVFVPETKTYVPSKPTATQLKTTSLIVPKGDVSSVKMAEPIPYNIISIETYPTGKLQLIQEKKIKEGKTLQQKFERGKISKFFEKQPKAELPYGLQEAIEFIQEPISKKEILKGEKFSLWLPTIWVGGKIGQTKFIQRKEKEFAEKYPELYEVLISPKVSGTLASVSATIPISLFFQPAISTGTTQQEQISKQISKTKFEKLKKLYSKIEKEVATKKTSVEQWKYINKMAGKVDKTNPAEVEGFRKLIAELEGKNILKPIKITIPQQPTLQTTPTLASGLQESLTGQKDIFFGTKTPQMKQLGLVLGGVSSLSPLQKLEQKTKQKELQKEKAIELETKRELSLLKQPSLFISTQVPSQIYKLRTRQEQQSKEQLIEREIQILGFPQSQISKFKSKLKSKPEQPQKLRIPKPKPKIPPPFFRFGELIKEARKRVEKKDLFEAFVRKGGKDISIGKFETKVQAQKELVKTLKSTLRASGFLTMEGKKIRADFLGREFGPSKVEQFRIVQRKEFRLGTKPEVKEIQFFKKGSKKSRRLRWI